MKNRDFYLKVPVFNKYNVYLAKVGSVKKGFVSFTTIKLYFLPSLQNYFKYHTARHTL